MLSGTRVAPPQLDEFFCANEADLRASDFAGNLGEPMVFANDLLQLRLGAAATTAGPPAPAADRAADCGTGDSRRGEAGPMGAGG